MVQQRSRLQITLFSAAALLFLLTLLSLTVHPPEDRTASWYETIFFGALSPLQKGATFIGRSAKDLVADYVNLVHVAADNRQLKQQVSSLESQLLLYRSVVDENRRLRSLLKYQQEKPWTTLAARIVAYSPQAEFRLVTINKGSRDGLKKRMPVISEKGLIGQIYRLGYSSAQVLLITDPTSAVDARLLDTGARGLIRGRILTTELNRNFFITGLEYIDREALVKIGSLVVTSGLDKVFPAGIPIGLVKKVNEDSLGFFKHAEVLPLSNFLSLRDVLVVTEW